MLTLNINYLFIITLTVTGLNVVDCTHLVGEFETKDFFKFLIKFGFQKTDRHQPEYSLGFIFGNITSQRPFHVPVTLAVLDRNLFVDFYKNRLYHNKETACKRMFARIKTEAFDAVCDPRGKDFLRRIPCPKGKLCVDEDSPWNVIRDNQFTYVVRNFKQPTFWYVSMVSCYLNTTTCEWHHYGDAGLGYTSQRHQTIDYDMWLVNGNPNTSSFSTLMYQFSFDRQNTVELYVLFWLCYMVLVPLQCHAVKTQRHPVPRLFTVSLLLDFLALCLILVHILKFSVDGIGYPGVAMAGDIFDILSRTTFMLLLLLLAKGWAVTRLELSWKPLVFAIWLCYGVVHILLYVWNLTEVDIIEDIDEYQTWPGWLMIVFRTLIMFWFLYELRTTMFYEHNMQKLNFLLHFGASSLVWFIYLPILALIALHVSALWRFKLLLGITYSADCFAYCVMAHLLWPTRSEQYFLLKAPNPSDIDELDEFDEAPHIVNTASSSAAVSLSNSLTNLVDITGKYEETAVKRNSVNA